MIAIAAGICDGLSLGDTTKAALITRGLAEISRLGTAMGAKKITFSGLSGLGDLITTCISLMEETDGWENKSAKERCWRKYYVI